MMLFKLSLRNVRKSIQDYMIYFVTLVIGVAVFYIFNAIGSQAVMLKVSDSTHEIIDLMTTMLSVFSVFVSFVLGFLVVYANSFLLKRRKKEFGVYFLLGMGKRDVSVVLLGETILVGMFSMVTGLAVGIVASQGMSVVVANMFEADMTQFRFTISRAALIKTVVYYIIMYVVVLVLDVFVVGKSRLIDLLNAGKKSEIKKGRNPFLCLIIFAAAVILLATAYYKVTAQSETIVTEEQLLVEIIKGIAGTFLLFWSMSGLLLFLEKSSKYLRYKGIHVFTVKELSSRINTTVFSGGIICLMLFVTICVFSSAMTVRKSINDNLQEMTPVDMVIDVGDETAKQIDLQAVLQEKKVDLSVFQDNLQVRVYQDEKLTMGDTLGAEILGNIEYSDYYGSRIESVMHLSEYNQVAKLYHQPTYSLADDEYMILCDFETTKLLRDSALERNVLITVGGKNYAPKYHECQQGFIDMASNHVNMGIILLPDDVDLSNFRDCDYYFLANYKETDTQSKAEVEEYVKEDVFRILSEALPDHRGIDIETKREIYENSIGITAMIVFLGVYLGIVFLISSAAILSLKELSEASDNRNKYQILRRIGVEEKMLRRSIFSQCAIFFGLPLVIAIVHSIFGIQVCMYILETFGKTGLLYSILLTAGVIVAVYGLYFIITYICSRKILEE